MSTSEFVASSHRIVPFSGFPAACLMPSCLTLDSLASSDCCACAAKRFALNRRPIAVNAAEVNRCLMQSVACAGECAARRNEVISKVEDVDHRHWRCRRGKGDRIRRVRTRVWRTAADGDARAVRPRRVVAQVAPVGLLEQAVGRVRQAGHNRGGLFDASIKSVPVAAIPVVDQGALVVAGGVGAAPSRTRRGIA